MHWRYAHHFVLQHHYFKLPLSSAHIIFKTLIFWTQKLLFPQQTLLWWFQYYKGRQDLRRTYTSVILETVTWIQAYKWAAASVSMHCAKACSSLAHMFRISILSLWFLSMCKFCLSLARLIQSTKNIFKTHFKISFPTMIGLGLSRSLVHAVRPFIHFSYTPCLLHYHLSFIC